MDELEYGRDHESDRKCAGHNDPKRWNSEQKDQHTPDREDQAREITADLQPVHRDTTMRMFGVFVLHHISPCFLHVTPARRVGQVPLNIVPLRLEKRPPTNVPHGRTIIRPFIPKSSCSAQMYG